MNPSWKYHANLEPKLVKSEAEDAALGPEWADSPAAFDPASPQYRGEAKPVQKRSRAKAVVEVEE